ncbi:MAG: Gfo/Idh/MocA family oxidoreductase [Phycisphaerales bacterium]
MSTPGVDRREFMIQAAGGLVAAAIVPNLARAARPSGMAPVRVGVVGMGRQGRSILAELSVIEGVELAAVCDVDERRLAAAQRRAADAATFASIDDLLRADAADAIIVATPTHTHREVATRAIEGGRHVYCEGPIAHTMDDAVAIARAARATDKVVAAGLQGRSNPVYDLARTFARSDSVRHVVAMRAQHNEKTSWVSPASDQTRYGELNWRLDPERSTGLAGEWGTQQFDVFHWYLGRYPVRVIGHGSIQEYDDGRKVHDTIACTLIFKDGSALQYGATLANSYEDQYEVFYGTNAAIKLAWSHGWMFKEADAPTQGWEVYANRQQFHKDEGITLIAGATKLAEQGKLKEGVGLPHSSLYYALENWIGAISTGGEPACSISEGARATAVGIAANRACVEGASVDIELPDV